MNKLESLLAELEKAIPHAMKSKNEVSSSNVGWHIEHSLLTLDKITESLANSNPSEYSKKFSLVRLIVFTLKKIPRGKAKSPASVQPSIQYSAESLMKHIMQTRENIKVLQTISKDRFFDHPVFNHLQLEQTVKFLEIHSKHHLDIIQDIIH
ncbi:MAG: hypothetical protein KA198_06435 [Chitinophagaceae bacterium]|nr:hypothetical protein [Chitinophagaceae bacterium]